MKPFFRIAMAALVLFPAALHAATFTVINTNASGAGSFQQAILDANSNPGADDIAFNISSGGLTISPSNALPNILEPLTINGRSQPGFTGAPIVELNGISAGANVDGLRIVTSNCAVRALVINRFTGDGIEITNALNTVVEGCYIGLNVAGAADLGNTLNGIVITNASGNLIGGPDLTNRNYISGNNGIGIHISGVSATNNSVVGNVIGLGVTNSFGNSIDGIRVNAPLAVIGGATAGLRNIISANNSDGIEIAAGGTNCVVRGNWIGTDLNGVLDRGNSANGILVSAGGAIIGGAGTGEGNVISGNSSGVEFNGAGCTNNIVLGNIIGLDVSGTGALGNSTHGVLITSARGNVVGGTAAGEGNLIAFNTLDGISVSALNVNTNNTFRGNSIHDNGDLGIDLGASGITANDAGDPDVGANQLQNFPILTLATNTATTAQFTGQLNSKPSTVYTVDFYSSVIPDPLTNGEGQAWLAATNLTTGADSNVFFTVAFNVTLAGGFITATATDPFGNTSEFSPSIVSKTAVPGQIFTVVNTNNSGAGSLREAIINANNAVTVGDRIEFNIPGAGVQTISPSTPLPAIGNPVTIDGYTQPGSATNTSATAFNGTVLIRLDGVSAGTGADGLAFSAGDGQVVRGLMIMRFNGDGIQINSGSRSNVIEGNIIGLDSAGTDQGNGNNGVNIVSSSGNIIGGTSPRSRNVISGNGSDGVEIFGAIAGNNLVTGNLIGTDFNGTAARGNTSSGVFISGASDNVIGGSTAAARNLISANSSSGISLSFAGGTIVRGNYIGPDITGTLDLGNGGDGINVSSSTNTSIGGVTVGEGNLISGNNGDGIEINGSITSNSIVEGNFIGTTLTGAAALGNNLIGVNVNSGARSSRIGGIAAGQANIIAFNLDDGISVSTGTNNLFRANSIFSNGNAVNEIGIDLGTSGVTTNDVGDPDTGANQLQNFPVLTLVSNSVAGTLITGTLNSATNRDFALDFYSNVTPDSSGAGQGQVYLGSTNVTTDGNGNGAFTLDIPVINLTGRYVTATATDTNGNTSEFATNYFVRSTVPGQVFTVVNTNDSGAGSLRQAILDANTNVSAGDLIAFNIPAAGVQTIRPSSPLPTIIDPVTINGYTQPGSVTNSSAAAFNGTLLIRLDGASAGASVDGLTVTVGGSTIRGLVIINFAGDGIDFPAGSSNAIEGNILGLDVDSTDRGNAMDGIHIAGSSFNAIGGPDPSQRNVISGNGSQGIDISGTANGNQVMGNLIGPDLTGTLNRGNSGGGIAISGTVTNTFGGASALFRNVISGNSGVGINAVTSGGNLIQGNYIGTTVSGTTALGNVNDGIQFNNVTNSTISGNVISGNGNDGIELFGFNTTNNFVINNFIGTDSSGTATNQNAVNGVNLSGNARFNVIGTESGPNVIAFNTADGVSVAFTCTNISIRANAIYYNGDLGIDLGNSGITTNDPGDFDTGANQQQNFPVLTTVTNSPAGTQFQGVLNSRPNTTFILDFYSNLIPDSSGSGQGQVWLGATNVTTDASSNALFAVTLPVTNLIGRFITATATDPAGNTSEFATNVLIASTITGFTYLVVNTNDSGPGSLRQAILDANATVTAGDTIAFAITNPGSPKTITLSGALPAITDPVTIDGYSQPGSVTNSSATAFNGSLMVRLDGTNAGTGVDGLRFTIGFNTVRGLAIINFAGATADGLDFNNSGFNIVQGCLLGIDVNGKGRPNGGNGVRINNSPNNRIGGTAPADRNVISGNIGNGIELTGGASSSNLIQGNIIGLDHSGTTNVGNVLQGVYVNGAPRNTIGGTSAAARNVISGNTNSGVYILSLTASNNLVVGNYVGTDITGLLDRGNGRDGVEINGAGANQVGDGTAAGRNILSGNGTFGSGDLQNGDGVVLNNAGARSNVVIGNFIGTDITGNVGIPNEKHGIAVYNGAFFSTLTSNVISSNLGHAVDIAFGSPNNTVVGNIIGVGLDRTTPMGNAGAGVLINFGSTGNTVGGVDPSLANLIANNATGVAFDNSSSSNRIIGNTVTGNPNRGIHVNSGTFNTFSQNLVFSNGGLGIDLTPIGVSANDPLDTDLGANFLQNFPVLIGATNTGTGINIGGSLNSASNTLYRIEFFANAAGDASGYGEGQTYLGFINVTTDGSGNANFTASFSPFPAYPFITATATDPPGNTSEFSAWISAGSSSVPSLSVQLTNSTQLVVSWPVAASGFVLETATNLLPVISWSAVTNSVSTNGLIQYVILNINPGEPMRFFRLKQ